MSMVERMQRLDRIKKAIDEDSDVMLTESERNEKVELLAVVSLLLNPKKTVSRIIKILNQEHNLSERQAFRRLTDAKFVFGNVFSHDRALERMKAFQRAEMAWKIALDKKDPYAMTTANDQMMKIVGADDPNDQIDPTKLEPSIYKAVLPPAAKKLLDALGASGAVDLSALFLKAGLISEAEVVDPDEAEEAKET